jgi:DNA/RNA-binding domain of Phe-tRNA-synthetase-like protein
VAAPDELGEGAVSGALRAEFPALRLRTATVTATPGRTPREVRDRLRALSDRVRGAQAVALRRQPVPSAYRVFYRHVGLDPDVQRVASEEAMVARLVRGGYESRGMPDDALLIALVETGVPVWALDAERLHGELELRDEGGRGLVVADGAGPVADLFAAVDGEHAVSRRTTAMTLYAVQVPDVPDLFVEEALWTCLELLG